MSAAPAPGAPDPYWQRKLILAARDGREAMFEKALTLGARPDAEALAAAIANQNDALLARCLELGANPNEAFGALAPPICLAARHARFGSPVIAQLLSAGADPNAIDPAFGRSAFMCLCDRSNEHLPEFLALLEAGAAPLARTCKGETAMHLLLSCGHENLARLLWLREPGVLALTDARGATPLHLALNFTQAKTALGMLWAGANPATRDKRGRDAWDAARENRYLEPECPELMEALRMARARFERGALDQALVPGHKSSETANQRL